VAAAAARRERAQARLRPALALGDRLEIRLEIRHDPVKGRGVFACAGIPAGALIEAAPVVVVPAAQRAQLDSTVLHDYYLVWDGETGGEGCAAVALGLVSLCNHSRRPSARVRRNRARQTLDVVAMAPIPAGGEITIDYNCPLWFDVHD
jgi:SET domain-containing protein